jgi:hypothetical protein
MCESRKKAPRAVQPWDVIQAVDQDAKTGKWGARIRIAGRRWSTHTGHVFREENDARRFSKAIMLVIFSGDEYLIRLLGQMKASPVDAIVLELIAELCDQRYKRDEEIARLKGSQAQNQAPKKAEKPAKKGTPCALPGCASNFPRTQRSRFA